MPKRFLAQSRGGRGSEAAPQSSATPFSLAAPSGCCSGFRCAFMHRSILSKATVSGGKGPLSTSQATRSGAHGLPRCMDLECERELLHDIWVKVG